MDIHFSLDGSIDLVAIYAALLSSILGVWEFFKWKHRHAIRLSVTPNMLFFPSSDNQTYIVAKVTNIGQTATTITHFIGHHWPSFWHKLIKKEGTSFVVNAINTPHLLQPGEQWMGQAIQNDEMERFGSTGVFRMGIIHSMNNKEVLKRVRIVPKAERLQKKALKK